MEFYSEKEKIEIKLKMVVLISFIPKLKKFFAEL